MFFTEFIVVFYSIFLLGYISFFIKAEYSSSVISYSLNNFSQIVITSLILSLSFLDNFNFVSFSNCFHKDAFSFFFQTILVLSLLSVVFLTKQYISTRLSFRQEYELLVILSFVGLLLLCFSSNLLIVYLAIELQSLVFYTLSSFQKNSEFSGEAGLKYFVLGSFSSGFLLFGFANIYLFTSAWSFEIIHKITFLFVEQTPPFFFGLLLILASFLFKLGAFPFHIWVCDVYEGSPFSVTMFFVLVPKAVIFCVFAKLFFSVFGLYYSFWANTIVFCAFLSVIVGNIAALYQKKLKRLLAFSAIAHSGFILLPFCCFSTFAIKAFSFYFFFYILMNISVFSIVIVSFSRQNFLKFLINWSDVAKRNFVLILIFSTILFSTAGIPPLGGFYSKLLVFFALVQQKWLLLTIFLTLFSCVGCYYYIRLIKTFFFRSKNTTIWISGQTKVSELIISTVSLFVVTFLWSPDFVLLPIDLICFTF